jgi:hypothetical protein
MIRKLNVWKLFPRESDLARIAFTSVVGCSVPCLMLLIHWQANKSAPLR